MRAPAMVIFDPLKQRSMIKKKIIQIMEMLPDTKFKDLYAIIP